MEADIVTDKKLYEVKSRTRSKVTPSSGEGWTDFVEQADAYAQAAKETGKEIWYIFEKTPSDDVISYLNNLNIKWEVM